MSTVRRASALAVPLLLMVAVAACGGNGSDGGTGDTGASGGLSSLLAQIPALERDGDIVQYTYGDLVSASRDAGVERPTSLESGGLVDWVGAIAGSDGGDEVTTVVVPLPWYTASRLDEHATFADEIGWSLLDVDRFLEVITTPEHFVLIDGSVDPDAVDDAVGPARNGIWSLGRGPDFVSVYEDTSIANPLGQPLRMVGRGSSFAVSDSTEMARDFAGEKDLGGDAGFTAVARQLDEAAVYGAYLATMPADSRFDTIGIGVSRIDDGTTVTIVYHAADDVAAASASSAVDAAIAANSIRTRGPWSEIFPESEVTVTGANVVATLRLAPDRSPGIIADILFSRDTIVDV